MYISYELHVTGFQKTNEPVNKLTEFIINFYFLYLVIRFAIINCIIINSILPLSPLLA